MESQMKMKKKELEVLFHMKINEVAGSRDYKIGYKTALLEAMEIIKFFRIEE